MANFSIHLLQPGMRILDDPYPVVRIEYILVGKHRGVCVWSESGSTSRPVFHPWPLYYRFPYVQIPVLDTCIGDLIETLDENGRGGVITDLNTEPDGSMCQRVQLDEQFEARFEPTEMVRLYDRNLTRADYSPAGLRGLECCISQTEVGGGPV